MTQIARLFPHLPVPEALQSKAPDRTPTVGQIAAPGPRGARLLQKPFPEPATAPTDFASGRVETTERHSLQRLSRLLAALESSPAVPDDVRAMPGMAVLRQHFEMHCALEGLLRGLIKE